MTDDPAQRLPLDQQRLAAAAATGGLGLPAGATVEVVDVASSTNALVAARARDGSPAWLVVAAEHQTAGRGRLDRSWETPARSALTFSVLLRPEVSPAAWPWLPLLTGLAVDRALTGRGFAAGLKWPNDVLIAERKVAGILVERVETDDGPAAIVGIGLNVSLTADELPVPTATSLAMESGTGDAADPTGTALDRTGLLVDLLSSLARAHDAWASGDATGARDLATSYAERCVTIGRQVRVDLPGGRQLSGRATAVDADGRLVVDHDGGRTAVGAGDVVHVRSVSG